MELNDEFELMDMEDGEFEFTLSEIIEMENLFKEMRDEFLCQNFSQELATKFSHSVHRSEKSPVKWEQVQSWFQDKQSALAAKAIPSFYPEETLTSPVKRSGKACLLRLSTISISEAAVELPNLMFEARSAKDYAGLMLRISSLSEFLTRGSFYSKYSRVRFAGFDREEDEWVNEYYALYVDAHITGIERELHDESCVFNVRVFFNDKQGIEFLQSGVIFIRGEK